jgi:hypothetical protein
LGTPLELIIEPTLSFDDVRLAFMSVFPLSKKEITKELVIEKLGKKDIKNDWSLPFSKNFGIAEDFLIPQRISDQYFRLKLSSFNFSFEKLSGEELVNGKFEVSVFLTIYPKVGVGILLFNMKLSQCDSDDLIFLQQSAIGKTKIKVALSPPFGGLREMICSFEEVDCIYIDKILTALEMTAQDSIRLRSRCLEICSVSNFRIDNPKKLFENFPKQMYGLLVADEGWRFVPIKVAKDRIQLKWRTRSFLNVFAFAQSILFINLKRCQMHKKYIESQKQLREKYAHKVEEYFVLAPEIAGLNHGPLLMLENASVQGFIIAQIEEQIVELKLKNIKELLRFREKLLDALLKLSHIKIPEIGLLEQNVQNAMKIPKRIAEAKKKLEDVERTLLIRYNQRINLWIIVLTIVSLGIGILGILLETGLLNNFLDALLNLHG